jgi:monoamine oxidase
MTFEQYCRDAGAGTQALQTARVWTRGTLGQDPSDVSALAYLEVCRGGLGIVNLRYDGKHGAQFLRLQEGTQSISVGMAKLLPTGTIKLSTPVASITQQLSELYSIATTDGNKLQSRKVIISMPEPTYKNITFDPPLSLLKKALYEFCEVWMLCQTHLLVRDALLATARLLWTCTELSRSYQPLS